MGKEIYFSNCKDFQNHVILEIKYLASPEPGIVDVWCIWNLENNPVWWWWWDKTCKKR